MIVTVDRLHLQEFLLRSALTQSYIKIEVKFPNGNVISGSTPLVDSRAKSALEVLMRKDCR